MDDVVAPVDHNKEEVQPVAVNVADSPEQIEALLTVMPVPVVYPMAT